MSGLLQALWAAYNLANNSPAIAKQLALAIRQETLNVTAKDVPSRRKKVDPYIPTYEEVDIGRGWIPGEGGGKGKIAMIKAYRDRTGRGLKESKDACEDWFAKHGYAFHENPWNK